MTYTRPLPREDSLTRLVSSISFPATRDEIIIAARYRGASTTMIHFLKLFSVANTFENRLDFLNQSLVLERALRRAMPSRH